MMSACNAPKPVRLALIAVIIDALAADLLPSSGARSTRCDEVPVVTLNAFSRRVFRAVMRSEMAGEDI
jgi:hypothetical protein